MKKQNVPLVRTFILSQAQSIFVLRIIRLIEAEYASLGILNRDFVQLQDRNQPTLNEPSSADHFSQHGPKSRGLRDFISPACLPIIAIKISMIP